MALGEGGGGEGRMMMMMGDRGSLLRPCFSISLFLSMGVREWGWRARREREREKRVTANYFLAR